MSRKVKTTCRVAATVVAATGGASIGALAVLSGPAGATSSTLGSGQTLTGGQELAAGSYTLIMQTDGNLVEYTGGSAVWQTHSSGEPGNRLVMQTDGNLVMYGSGNQVRWQTHTQGYSGAHLALQTDDNIVVYSTGGSALWAKSWTESAAGAQSYAQVIMPSYGWSVASQYQYLNNLWTHESNWQWNVCSGGGTYPTCNYTGIAYGVPQSDPGNKMAASGTDWATNDETQIQWGLTYIANRYGTPQAAWNHDVACGFCGYAPRR